MLSDAVDRRSHQGTCILSSRPHWLLPFMQRGATTGGSIDVQPATLLLDQTSKWLTPRPRGEHVGRERDIRLWKLDLLLPVKHIFHANTNVSSRPSISGPFHHRQPGPKEFAITHISSAVMVYRDRTAIKSVEPRCPANSDAINPPTLITLDRQTQGNVQQQLLEPFIGGNKTLTFHFPPLPPAKTITATHPGKNKATI